MQVFANVATQPERKTSKSTGKHYYEFRVPESQRGAAYGVTNGATLMGNVLGPLAAGALSMIAGLTAIFWLTAILFLTAFGLLLHYHLKSAEECPATSH